ncbi:MAG: hypothetical protein ABH950_09765 [Candidatus Altiarchaeota archaeon]
MRSKAKLTASLIILVVLVTTAQAADCGGSTPCECGDTVIESYNLTQNLSCPDHGLTIGSNGTILDCQGFEIVGNLTYYRFGLIVTNKVDITIQNWLCRNA